MSESRNSVTNSLDAESGVSVKSRVSRGRRLLESVIPCLKESRLRRERKEAMRRAFLDAQRSVRIAEAMAELDRTMKPFREAVSRAAEMTRRFGLVLQMKKEITKRPRKSTRRTYRRIKEKA